MTQQTIAQPPGWAPVRRVDLDWVRISAFGLLILYHVGMFYVSWGWHIKSAFPVPALEPLMLVLNPWRLAVLFLVSGVATRFMLGKTAPGALLRTRSSRLLVPLVFGMFVIVPPQAYLQIVEASGYADGFLEFYRKHYLAFGKQFCPNPCIILPTWNHLWFVAYLWVYTVALGLVLLALPGIAGRIEPWLLRPMSGIGLLIVPSLLFAAFRIALLPRFPSTHALFGDWYNHALFASVFLLGFLLAHAPAFWEAVERRRWIALILAAAFYACWIWLRSLRGSGLPIGLVASLAYGFYQWLCIVTVLGFARRWLNRDSAARRYLTDAIFPYYIVHQTAIIVIAHALRGRGISTGVEATIIIAGTAAICIATYEIVRRVDWLRPLFGLKREEPPAGMPMRAGRQPAN